MYFQLAMKNVSRIEIKKKNLDKPIFSWKPIKAAYFQMYN